jgi:(E)-4-hydroxy-3-methylbut-2-enyl-diphosphate synthase
MADNHTNQTTTMRRKTRKIRVGNIWIGGDAPIPIQSMTCSKTTDLKNVLGEIERLEAAGCQLIRVAVPDAESAAVLPEIKKQIHIPLIADIHFDYRLALAAIDAGVDKIRINPGNIGPRKRFVAILEKARAARVPLRIGVNSGSLEKDLLQSYVHPTPAAMLDSIERQIAVCQEHDFKDMIISLKSSDVSLMLAANRRFAEKYDYPLHLGVTEAGPYWQGTIRSAIGIGTLLAEGIGDTIRVSLTGDPEEEVHVAREILKSLNLRQQGITIISCPTCARTEINLSELVNRLERQTRQLHKNLKVAVMGCVVNGPGEAREADLGVAGGKQYALFFKKGQVIAKIKQSEIYDVLMEAIDAWPDSVDNSE